MPLSMTEERIVYDSWINPLCDSIRNVVEVEKRTAECLEGLVTDFLATQTVDKRSVLTTDFRSFGQFLTDQMPRVGVLMITDVHVRRCLKYLDDHLAEPYSLRAVALYSGMSRAGLCRVFKSNINQTIKQYLVVLRMRKAMQLLIATGLMIVEISELCGYSETSRFINHFKGYTGFTPLAYRNGKRSPGLS